MDNTHDPQSSQQGQQSQDSGVNPQAGAQQNPFPAAGAATPHSAPMQQPMSPIQPPQPVAPVNPSMNSAPAPTMPTHSAPATSPPSPAPAMPAGGMGGQTQTAAGTGQTSDSGSFADFKKQEDAKQPFDPATPVTSTLGQDEETILSGDKNIFGRPITSSGVAKPKDAKGQFEYILSQKIPAHTLQFNEQDFLELLAGSISLLFDEKLEIIRQIPNMKQEQIDKLLEILKDEKSQFEKLVKEHQEEVQQKKVEEMKEVKAQEQQFLAQEETRKDDDLKAAEDLLKGLE